MRPVILTTSTANIRRWLVVCDTCGHRADAFTATDADTMAGEHAALHQAAA